MRVSRPDFRLAKFNASFAKAMEELQTKHLSEIQAETALTWCARACAWATLHPLELDRSDATEYAHEALEHAALCGDDTVIVFVRKVLKQYGVGT